MSLQSLSFRLMAGHSDAKRDRGLNTAPDDILRINDIPYGPDVKWNTLDVYRPKNLKGKLPVIVNVHGGGYVYGSTKQYQFYCMDLARRGFAVVSFNYHLAPKFKFPTPIFDLNLVMEWICKKADIHGFDTDKVALVGDSAGAQLTSQYAVICSNPEYAEVMEVTPPDFRLRAVGLNCGMYDLRKRASEISENKLMIDYFTEHPSVYGKKLDVLDYVTEDFPPAYLLTAKGLRKGISSWISASRWQSFLWKEAFRASIRSTEMRRQGTYSMWICVRIWPERQTMTRLHL